MIEKYVVDLRLRDSYKRFVKTWIRFANPWICTVSWITNPDFKRFVSYRESRIQSIFKRFVLRIRFVTHFQKIRRIRRILQILTNPQYYRLTNPYKSCTSGFANPVNFQKIRFVDSFRDAIFKYPFRGFDSQDQKSQKIRFVSFWKDSYTNPASLG